MGCAISQLEARQLQGSVQLLARSCENSSVPVAPWKPRGAACFFRLSACSLPLSPRIQHFSLATYPPFLPEKCTFQLPLPNLRQRPAALVERQAKPVPPGSHLVGDAGLVDCHADVFLPDAVAFRPALEVKHARRRHRHHRRGRFSPLHSRSDSTKPSSFGERPLRWRWRRRRECGRQDRGTGAL